jgi:hypothetical protein
VFPILRDKCARCHVAGGVAPMSLMTYDEAFPWAESIRAELVANHMPPWNAEEGFGAFKAAHTLSPRELDIILTWATGGNPRGQLDQKLPPIALKNDWTMGAPDLALPLPSEFTVAGGQDGRLARVRRADRHKRAALGARRRSASGHSVDRTSATISVGWLWPGIWFGSASATRRARARAWRGGCQARIRSRLRHRVPRARWRAARGPHPLQEDLAVRRESAQRSQHGRRLFRERRRAA